MFSLTRNGYSITPFIRMHIRVYVKAGNRQQYIISHKRLRAIPHFIFHHFFFFFFGSASVSHTVRFYMFGNGGWVITSISQIIILYPNKQPKILYGKEKKENIFNTLVKLNTIFLPMQTDYSKFIFICAVFPPTHTYPGTRNNDIFSKPNRITPQ